LIVPMITFHCLLMDPCWRCGALIVQLAGGVASHEFRCTACGVRLGEAPSLG
jgi:hypothetical protein